ncbi:hypothetical protein GTT93_005315 [Salmonella enterica]|nr:hypothetical protein [Salmonella enterica]
MWIVIRIMMDFLLKKAMIFSMMNTLLLFMWLRVLIKPAKNSTNYCLVVDIGKMVRGMQVR